MSTLRAPASGKYWRLTFSRIGVNSRFGRVQSWTFLTVEEALEHCRLNAITKFKLEDLKTRIH